jgi:hypothetical protein
MHRASVYRVGAVRRLRATTKEVIATGLSRPYDVEEVEGGWLVACRASVEFVGGGGERLSLAKAGVGHREIDFAVSLATVPGLGLVVREYCNGGRLQVFATPDTMAMFTNMSDIRIAWMSTVARAVFNRRANMLSRHWCRW